MNAGVGAAANSALRFALELAAFTALSVWGWHLGSSRLQQLALAVGAPMLAVFAWGLFVAPRASHYLSRPGRLLVEAAVFAAAALALVELAHPYLAVAFALLAVMNTALIHALQQDLLSRAGATERTSATARR